MILKANPLISFQGEYINFSRMNNYFKVKEYWLGVDLGNRIFLKENLIHQSFIFYLQTLYVTLSITVM